MKSETITIPEIINGIPSEVMQMIQNPGIYFGYDPRSPGSAAPILSMYGKLHSMQVDSELDPTRFIIGHCMDGPLPFPGKLPEKKKPSAPATNREQWIVRCAARLIARGVSPSDIAVEIAESQLENLDGDISECPEEAADEEISNWPAE